MVGYGELGVACEQDGFCVNDVDHSVMVSFDSCVKVDDAIRSTKMCWVKLKFMYFVWIEYASVVVPVAAEM